MIALERRTVSRKTPNDGRLEITKRVAEKLETLRGAFAVEIDGVRSAAKFGTMGCTCRGADNPHVHYFVEPFKRLAPASEVDLELDADGAVLRVQVAPSRTSP